MRPRGLLALLAAAVLTSGLGLSLLLLPAGMEKLRLLSLSRNKIKKIERLEGACGSRLRKSCYCGPALLLTSCPLPSDDADVADTLEELWLSYNAITSLDGLAPCKKLQVLYLGNNKIADWAELDKLAALPELR